MPFNSIFNTPLTEFNPHLFSSLEAEAFEYIGIDRATFEGFNNEQGQHYDVYAAYLYAQTEILPKIQANKAEAITPENILTWLNEIHKRIARTLAQSIKSSEFAGIFSPEQILRWEASADFSKLLGRYLKNKITEKDLITLEKENANIPAKTIRQFLTLIDRIKTQVTTCPQDSSTSSTNKKVTEKLISDYHSGKLTALQKKTVDAIVKICIPPEKIPEHMDTFIRKLASDWQTCNPNNMNEILELAYQAFFGLTEIHPYFNGNGRTATCLMNIVLRSLDQPSILMRTPNEKGDTNSSYSKAIAKITTHPELFKEHVKLRIQLEKETPYKEEDRHTFFEIFGKIYELLETLKPYRTSDKLRSYYQFITISMTHNVIQNDDTCTQQEIFEETIHSGPSYIAKLEHILENAMKPQPATPENTSDENKNKILTQLKLLTQCDARVIELKPGILTCTLFASNQREALNICRWTRSLGFDAEVKQIPSKSQFYVALKDLTADYAILLADNPVMELADAPVPEVRKENQSSSSFSCV